MEKLSEERLEKIRQLITNPRPGSKVAAAQEFGVDLTLLLRKLRLTPEQRLDDLQHMMESFEDFRHEAARSLKVKRD